MIEEFGAGAQKGTGAMQFALERDRFRPNWRRGEVLTKRCKSTYSPIYDKGWTCSNGCRHTYTFTHTRAGIVDASLDCYPHGYTGYGLEFPISVVKQRMATDPVEQSRFLADENLYPAAAYPPQTPSP